MGAFSTPAEGSPDTRPPLGLLDGVSAAPWELHESPGGGCTLVWVCQMSALAAGCWGAWVGVTINLSPCPRSQTDM